MRKDISGLKRTLEETNEKLDSLTQRLEAPDPVEFCVNRLGFTPTVYQRRVLLDPSQLVCLRWSRQSGKTVTVSAKILWTAVTRPGSAMAVVAPSLRQSKAVIHRIASLAKRLPEEQIDSIQKTRIDFTNGSTVEAFPNNPSTIRGPSWNVVYCDEMGFIRDDKDLYDAILFTISTTNGTFIASSTPGGRDSLFYKICHDPAYNFSRHHVTWKQALEPEGPLKQKLLEAIRGQLESDPWRWRREMEAEFAEDEESFFSLALITKAVDENLSYRYASERLEGRSLYAGLDFGKHHDHSALAVVDYDSQSKKATLVHMKQFPLGTDYGNVIGYVKVLSSNWNKINRITTDTTGVGDVVTDEMRKTGLGQTWGITLTAQSKVDIMENLHRMLAEEKLSLVYDLELISEMNAERYETSKTGQLLFSHRAGTHDDRLWALALACHGLRYGISILEYHPFAATGKPKWRIALPTYRPQISGGWRLENGRVTRIVTNVSMEPG